MIGNIPLPNMSAKKRKREEEKQKKSNFLKQICKDLSHSVESTYVLIGDILFVSKLMKDWCPEYTTNKSKVSYCRKFGMCATMEQRTWFWANNGDAKKKLHKPMQNYGFSTSRFAC